MQPVPPAAPHPVVPGLERWLAGRPEDVGLGRGARIALLAHAASVDRAARHAVDRILDDGRYALARILAPEHGLWGHEQDMERVDSRADPASGIEVVSLYGSDEASLRPPAGALDGIDALVVDLQDVGARYYTYVYTMAFAMEAARDAGVRVVVLDRPNPVGGTLLEGPVLDPACRSFVGWYPLPVRHGMTIGELARLFDAEFGIGCEPVVVPLAGWPRSVAGPRWGLPWVPPSPNMPAERTALVYPGGCLVEGTELSEGRGTTTPFELVGAPGLDGRALAAALSGGRGDEALAGALFRPASFRPMFGKHAGVACGGVQVIPTDPDAFRPFRTYLALLREAIRLLGDRFAWRTRAYEFVVDRPAIDLLLGREDLRPLLERGADLAEMEALWAGDLERFAALREGFLLYPAGSRGPQK